MLIFRAAQNREIIPAVLVMLGIQKINVTKAEPDIRFEIIVVEDVPHLGVERIKTDGILAIRIIEIVSGRRCHGSFSPIPTVVKGVDPCITSVSKLNRQLMVAINQISGIEPCKPQMTGVSIFAQHSVKFLSRRA